MSASVYQGILGVMDWVHGPYRARSELKLQVDGPAFDPECVPFQLEKGVSQFSINLEAGEGVRVSRISNRGHRETLFDGRACRLDRGVRIRVTGSPQEGIHVALASGQEWSIYYSFKNRSLGLAQWGDLLSLKGAVASAGALQLLTVLVGGLAIHRSSVGLAERMKEAEQFEASIAPSAAVLLQARMSEVAPPFSGISLKAWERMKQDQSLMDDTGKPAAKKTMAMMDGLFGAGKLGKAMGRVGGGAAPIAVNTQQTQGLIQQALQAQRDSVPQAKAPPVPRAVAMPQVAVTEGTTQERRERTLRQSVDGVKPRLSRAFDEALRVDPQLSVTLVYEAVINSSGHLSQVKVQARGQGSRVALEGFTAKVRQILESVSVGREFAGTPVRGEQIFIR